MRVGVIFGGDGTERDVSRASAAQVIPALRSREHDVVAIDATDGVIAQAGEPDYLTASVEPTSPAVIERSLLEKREILSRVLAAISDVDVVFIAMHGGIAEDGQLPAFFGLAGIPFTGSSYLASAVTMDKDVSKRLFRAAGLVTPDWLVDPVDTDHVAATIGFPAIVKPVSEGSTVGVSIVRSRRELESAMTEAGQYGRVMLERFIEGRELTVGVLGDEPLAVGEIHLPRDGLFSYEHKYQGATVETFPADVSHDLAESARTAALTAHTTLGIGGYSRSDFLLDDDGTMWIMETNNLPGLTATSLLPQSAAAAGIDYEELCDRICRLAMHERG